MSLLMESFFVFVILECFMILYYILYFHYEPKPVKKKVWDPLGLYQIKEQENVRKRFKQNSR